MGEHETRELEITRMKAVHQYIQALERGDLDAATQVLEAALNDAELDRILAEVEQAYLQEQGLTPMAADAQLVHNLVRDHLPSAFAEETPADAPLTVGEVAARLQADRRVPSTDDEAHRQLLSSTLPLPTWLSLPAIRKLASNIGVAASDRFWRAFRDTAITMGMGRSHSHAQWAAARETRTRRDASADNTKPTSDITPSAEEQRQ